MPDGWPSFMPRHETNMVLNIAQNMLIFHMHLTQWSLTLSPFCTVSLMRKGHEDIQALCLPRNYFRIQLRLEKSQFH